MTPPRGPEAGGTAVEADVHQRRIVAGVRNATRILTIGSLLSVAVVAARVLSGGDKVQLLQIAVPLDRLWPVLAALTVVHVFLSVFLVRGVEEYRRLLPSGDRAGRTFDEVTADGNGFVHGLVSRALPRRADGHIHRMSWSDPSTWVAYAAALLTVVAVLPWSWGESGPQWDGGAWAAASAPVIVGVNWWAGGLWLIALSTLDQIRVREDADRRSPVDEEELARMARLHEELFEPGLTRSRYEWLTGRYRALADSGFRIRRVSGEGDATRAPTDEELQDLALHYGAVRDEFPYADLPPEPWTAAERTDR